MAEGKHVSVEKGVKELEKEITCAICHEHYTEPKVLSCCHYYCKKCIHDLAKKKGPEKPFACPECRKDTSLPEGSVDNLQAAFFVNRMKDVHSKLERATGKVEVMCEICSEDKAEAFCRQCVQFICAECVKSHKRMKKSFPGHIVTMLQELKQGGAKEIVSPEPSPSMCKLHKDPIRVYCFDCSSLICRDCTIKGHLGHNYEFITVAGPDMKEKLIQHLDPLRVTKKNFLLVIDEVRASKSGLDELGQSAVTEIKKSFAELHQVLSDREEELLQEFAAKVDSKKENLCNQEKDLSTASSSVQSVMDFTQQCVEHSTDEDILSKHVELQDRVNREIAEQEKKNLQPVEEVDFAVEVSLLEELKQLCQTKAKITQLLPQCSADVKKAELEVDKVCEAIVTINLSNRKPTYQECAIDCDLKRLASGDIIKCEVNKIKGNEYRIQYTPTVRGRHQLAVRVNEQEVAGSPFPVFVSINPMQLGEPVRVIRTLGKTRDVAVNSRGDTIVLDSENISVFDKDGKKLKSREWSSFLSSPWGITLDGDCIYLTDYSGETSKIVKLNSDLGFETSTSHDSSLLGIAVTEDEIVCSVNCELLVAFTKELKYKELLFELDTIQKSIQKISYDGCGHLYVCSDMIDVYGSDYKLVRTFGEDLLNNPYACAVDREHVYVADCENYNIAVFTTGGEHVTSFGKKGEGKGNFCEPDGVFVDKDGFVYVCDKSQRVQIF